jgi:Rieske Fe-S protein
MVPWNEQRRAFPCPCHASAFDEKGDVLAPPATRALDLFPVVIEAGIVKVDTSRRIERSRFEPGQVTYL